ncbi:uncharacterized protein topaz1 isoform X4 [Clinocottus analis]|uniref:uncharacterized protein topaz1 isoform X4 n=1 Tax=Clinocottus analis TaxID=304258 RepID=UPI0035C015CF
MLPSSSRVKLNRVAIKEFSGLHLEPRRRRLPKSVNIESKTREETQLVSASGPDGGEPAQTSLTGPGSATDATAEGEPLESRVDVDKHTHLSPTGLSGSGGSLRRVVRASGCGLCGDCISPQRKTLGEHGLTIGGYGPDQPPVGVKRKRAIVVTETYKKIIIWLDQYPKLLLCDVAQIYDASRHACGYVLPEVLKTKVVHCFKQEMRAGVQFGPACFKHSLHKSEECALAPSSEFSLGFQLEKSVRQPRSSAEHQGSSRERTDVLTLSGRFLESWTSESSATCSASLSLGECTKKRVECRTGMWDRGFEEEHPGPRCRQMGAANHRDKRKKLRDHVKAGILLSAPGFESNGCRDPRKNDFGDNEKLCRLTYDDGPPCLEHAVVGSSSFSLSAKENGVHEKSCGEIENPVITDDAQMLREADVVELESFTCQRVRPYFRKIKITCARTCMPWPFSNSGSTRGVHADTTDCPSEPPDPSAGENSDSPLAQHQPGSYSNRTDEAVPAPPSAHQVSRCIKERRDEDREGVLDERNGKRHAHASSYTHFTEAEASIADLHSNASSALSNLGQVGIKGVTASFWPLNGSKTDSSTSTSSPSALGLSDCETGTTLSPMSSPFMRDGLSSLSATPSSLTASLFTLKRVEGVESFAAKCTGKAVEEALFVCEEKQRTSWASSSAPPNNSDSFDSCESFLLSQHEQKSDDRFSPSRVPPSDTSPFNHVVAKEGLLHNILTEKYVEKDSNEFLLPLMLSPVTSPRGPRLTRLLPQRPGCSDDEEDMKEIIKDARKHKMWPAGDMQHIVHGSDEDDVEQDNKISEQVSSYPKIEVAVASLTGPCSTPSGDEDDARAFSDEGQTHSAREEGTCPSDMARSERAETHPEDDPELFENLTREKLLKLDRTRVPEASAARPVRLVKTLLPRMNRGSLVLKQSLTPVSGDFHRPDINEDRNSRTWRPRCSGSIPSKTQSNAWPAAEKQTINMVRFDSNNNHVNKVLDRTQPIPTGKSELVAPKNVPANMMEFKQQKATTYCRQYFSESLSCGFKVCRFQHVPVEGDEKLCVETVIRFTKNPMCLQKAGAMFAGYYQNNPPGVYFSVPVFLTLLWALLKAGMVSDVVSVLRVSFAHKIGPGNEFLLALFNIVRENGLTGVVPELMQLTLKMASAGLVLSLDSLESVKNTPEFQQIINMNSLVSASGDHTLSTSVPPPECLNLAHSIVEIELCTKQEDWMRMGKVFRSICQSSQDPTQVDRISGRILIALLTESKDKMSLPFAAFAKTVCQSDAVESQIRRALGRIGVSLMLRYHKTHQWAKGRRVVEVLSYLKINFSTLKGLFGNEDGASRCYLVTAATELFLLSGSLEGALNTLRENQWFLSSCAWPCEPADLESRTRVLLRLAEKTAHRDTLEVLSNLPGFKEPNDVVDTSRYSSLFNSHVRVCMDRQILPVASDAVDFMLYKKLPVELSLLQILFSKLGKQNHWLRARELFRHSLSMGYYPDVSSPPGFMTLVVPCRLGEVELALALEMFVAVNATDIFHLSEASTSCLSITLKRTQSCESEYLAAGSRILSAACIPQPKLGVHYTAVNASQDQVFTLNVPSARCWLHHNHQWAVEVWAH